MHVTTYVNLHVYNFRDYRLTIQNLQQSSSWKVCFYHSHKKQKDSLKTRAVLLIFSLEVEISGMAVQGIHQNSEKWLLSKRIFLVEITFRLFYPFYVLMIMVLTLLRQLRRSLQMKKKKKITNASYAAHSHSKKGWSQGHLRRS